MHIFDSYARTRARVVELIAAASSADMMRGVPACPEWTVRELTAHLVSMPAALGSGRLPDGEIPAWLDSLVAEREHQSVTDLLEEWLALDRALETLLTGPAGLLFDDLAVHEHDLRAALGQPDHQALEIEAVLPRALTAFSQSLIAAGVPPVAVRCTAGSWQSHEGEAGWTILVDPWEALRALSSRRTAGELVALAADGSAQPYLPFLDAHLPLPSRSLDER